MTCTLLSPQAIRYSASLRRSDPTPMFRKYTELSAALEVISRRSIGGFQKIEALMPSEVKQVLLQWKTNDETLRGKPQKHARRPSPARASRRNLSATADASRSNDFESTSFTSSRVSRAPVRVAWTMSQPYDSQAISVDIPYLQPQSSTDCRTDRYTPSPPCFSDSQPVGVRGHTSTTMTDQSVQTTGSDDILVSPSRLTDGRYSNPSQFVCCACK